MRRQEVQASWQSAQPHGLLLLSSVAAIAIALALVGVSVFNVGRLFMKAGRPFGAGAGVVSFRPAGDSLVGSLIVLFLAIIWIWAIVHFWRKSNGVRRGSLRAMGGHTRLYWLIAFPGTLLLFAIVVCFVGLFGRLVAFSGSSSQLDPEGRARELRRDAEKGLRGRGY